MNATYTNIYTHLSTARTQCAHELNIVLVSLAARLHDIRTVGTLFVMWPPEIRESLLWPDARTIWANTIRMEWYGAHVKHNDILPPTRSREHYMCMLAFAAIRRRRTNERNINYRRHARERVLHVCF